MPKDDILLIQGPPGTGKTHTIIGIVSMIMSTRLANSRSKIMVCAPSNAAIDQIVMRIIERGLIGLQGLRQDKDENADANASDEDEEEYELPDLSQTLIRITAAEH
jgi:tRNA(Met) C34 N-acetyltransferase TmcA